MDKEDLRHSNSGIRYPYSRSNREGKRAMLIRMRLCNGLTQAAVAKMLGCSKELYSHIENGHRDGRSIQAGARLADIFGVDEPILMYKYQTIESFDELITRKEKQ